MSLTLADVHPVDAPPGRPSAAQREALEDAEIRARQLLPGFVAPEWIWFHAPGARRLGLTRPGRLVYIRDDLSPAEVFRVALHELAHVADEHLIPTISREESEARAEAFEHFALRGDATMHGYHALCRRVEALCAQGLHRTAAWRQVNPGPHRLTDEALDDVGSPPAALNGSPPRGWSLHFGCGGTVFSSTGRCGRCWQLVFFPKRS